MFTYLLAADRIFWLKPPIRPPFRSTMAAFGPDGSHSPAACRRSRTLPRESRPPAAIRAGFRDCRPMRQRRGGAEILARDPVDLVLLDFNLPDGVATSFLQSVRQAGYGGKILIVTGAMDLDASSEALQVGASGIFLKHNPASSLLRAIRVTIAGDVCGAETCWGNTPDSARVNDHALDRSLLPIRAPPRNVIPAGIALRNVGLSPTGDAPVPGRRPPAPRMRPQPPRNWLRQMRAL